MTPSRVELYRAWVCYRIYLTDALLRGVVDLMSEFGLLGFSTAPAMLHGNRYT